MDLAKTQKALKSMDKAMSDLKDAGYIKTASAIESMYEGIRYDLDEALEMAKDIKQEMEVRYEND